MAIYMSDAYTWISKIDASGSFERNPPIIAYDEASSLPQAAFWIFILLPLFLLIFRREKNLRMSK
jgi:hypothetical protein